MDPFFERIAARIAEAPGVVSVALGGSWAREDADAESDVDFGVYYDPERPVDVEVLSGIAREIDDRHPEEPLTAIGGWGPWINGGGWLTIEGRRVDWIYRDLDRVGAAIADCRAGRVESHYQPGHPHAFHTHIYMGEVHHARPLSDPDGTLAALRRSTSPFPPALKRAIVEKFLWEADFALRTAEKSVSRGDAYHATGSFFRSVACVIQVLFAVNERYFVNEKRSAEAVSKFERRPRSFDSTVHAVFPVSRAELRDGWLRLTDLVEETRVLVGSS
jgi:Nucleotidyltransferase domain